MEHSTLQQMEHSTVSANGTQHTISKWNIAQYQQTEHSTLSAKQTQYSISELNTA
jgi:hypothetical protein